uniref:Uncharacterized protein n=1 Tax=Arundo donax TaxID=35708 RepID=A0A0A9A6W2_ARUDO
MLASGVINGEKLNFTSKRLKLIYNSRQERGNWKII